jgi:hypothetical protein
VSEDGFISVQQPAKHGMIPCPQLPRTCISCAFRWIFTNDSFPQSCRSQRIQAFDQAIWPADPAAVRALGRLAPQNPRGGVTQRVFTAPRRQSNGRELLEEAG